MLLSLLLILLLLLLCLLVLLLFICLPDCKVTPPPPIVLGGLQTWTHVQYMRCCIREYSIPFEERLTVKCCMINLRHYQICAIVLDQTNTVSQHIPSTQEETHATLITRGTPRQTKAADEQRKQQQPTATAA